MKEHLMKSTMQRKKTRELRQAGYQVVELWECQWRQMKEDNPEIQSFVKSLDWVAPLQPRDAFFGGRTGAVSLYEKTQGEEQILYADVTSLYPWVNKTQEYPVGHPVIISQPEQSMENYFGIAKVDMLPPEKLFHPVLPVKIKENDMEKLTFPLCGQCVREELAKPMLERTECCCHSDEERTITGTWCTPEINKAIEKGYQLLKVHEVWHFPERRTGLFANYVNTWLKRKTEAGGWPRRCDTNEKKEEYVASFKDVEDIELDPDKIQKNSGLKATAKLMLNSFWGKFGQRENLQQVKQCTSEEELYRYTEDDTLKIITVRIYSDHVVDVVYKHKDGTITPSNKTNVFVAAFTTCHARLKLYSYLEAQQQNVLYYDTDSIIYKWQSGQEKLPIGEFLGELKDELEGDIISEFVSGGAKNYGYRTQGDQVECKVRGFTLDERTLKLLNYESVKATVLGDLREPQVEPRKIVVTNPKYFDRDTTSRKVFLIKRTKKYGLVDKKTLRSYPYGYKRCRKEVQLLMDLLSE